MSDNCVLCGQHSSQGILENSLSFCCLGCRTVYYLLSSRGALENYDTNPLFLQAVRSGLISNPRLLQDIEKRKIEEGVEIRRLHLEIREMWCVSCAEVISYLLRLEKGIKKVWIDYATDLAIVDFAPLYISQEKIVSHIQSWGYEPVPFDKALGEPVSRRLYIRLAVASFTAFNAMMLATPIYASYLDFDEQGWGLIFAWISFGICLPALVYSGGPIYIRFWHSLKVGLFGMEALVVIGVTSAFILSVWELFQGRSLVYFDSALVIIAFVLFGKVLESKTKFTAKEALFQLSRSLPLKARLSTGKLVDIKEVAKDELLLSVAGEKIVLDGTVEEGEGIVNEASMTGESEPIIKVIGSRLISGTVLETGKLIYRVSKTSLESRLAELVRVCETQIEQKSAYVRALDPFVRYFVPAIVALSGIVLIFSDWYRALAVLLISCPCAIGIAVPLAESALMHKLASLGVVIRNRGALLKAAQTTLFAFDKTGTITTGLFQITSGGESLSNEQKIILSSLASLSRHPVARALIVSEEKVHLTTVYERQGHGIEGCYEGKRYALSATPSPSDFTEVLFSSDSAPLAIFRLSDTLREDVPRLLNSLKETMLLSGDKENVVQRVKAAAGFKEAFGTLTPLEKKEKIAALQKEHTVMFIGDGINDAPALAQADVGVSVQSGSDFTQAVADIVLTQDNLSLLSTLVEECRKGQKIIRQNLFWAFIYNIIGIGLAAFGVLNPLIAAFAMIMSSLSVILNSMRLKPYN